MFVCCKNHYIRYLCVWHVNGLASVKFKEYENDKETTEPLPIRSGTRNANIDGDDKWKCSSADACTC